MLALIQRVSRADVTVNGECVAEIGKGLLVLLGVEKDDNQEAADRLLQKVLAYRVFPDTAGKMNLSVQDVSGGLLVVSQFTLAAATDKGLRPSFSSAMAPAEAEVLYEYFVSKAQSLSASKQVQCGRFGADMQVGLINDGPVTFLLKSRGGE